MPGFRWRDFLVAKLPWIIVALQLAWAGYGVWPVTPVEGDEQGVIFGVEGMLRHDPLLLRVRYLYPVQPGSYQLLRLLTALTGAPVEHVFAAATVLGAAGFAVSSAWLLRRLLGWPLGWTLAGMLAAQEVTTAACYLNTSALAGGWAMLGVILAGSDRRWAGLAAGLALAFAGWIRADSLLVAPACLGVAYWRLRTWRAAAGRTAVIAAVSAVVLLLLFRASGSSVFSGAASYAARETFSSSLRVLLRTSFMLLSPLLGFMAVAGTLLLLWRRNLPLLLIMAGGALPSILAYGSSLHTAKYFYYLVPFALLPALVLADALARRAARLSPGRARLAVMAAAGLLAADGLVGFRRLPPELLRFPESPALAALPAPAVGGTAQTLVLGAGDLVANTDGFRVRTGQWFAPLCWHQEKERVVGELAIIRSWFEREPLLSIWWTGWVPYQLLTRELFAAGFKPEPVADSDTYLCYQGPWRRGEREVRVSYWPYADSDCRDLGAESLQHLTAVTYLLGDFPHHPLKPVSADRQWELISASDAGILTLYRLR